ncbi:MAG: HAD family phosphatase [Acidobacteriota bacterium]|nr:HAD family phosphatase [Acidobacteriota bacterium]
MLRALIFDFDGVIVDSEPLIMNLTCQMAAREGWIVTEEDYYRDYLALDDRGIVEHLFRTHGRPIDAVRHDELVRWKEEAYFQAIRDGLPPMPGAVNFVRLAAARFALAIASGSLRREVAYLLGKLGLFDEFPVLATADECERSKPDPCSYLTALRGLQALNCFHGAPLRAIECLAIEDAPAGIEAAHAAGMKCLAVSHSRPAAELSRAEWVAASFLNVDLFAIAEDYGRDDGNT